MPKTDRFPKTGSGQT
jgi:hypothetical protein